MRWLGYRGPARGHVTQEEIISCQLGKLQPQLPDIFHQRLSALVTISDMKRVNTGWSWAPEAILGMQWGGPSAALGPLCFTQAQAEVCADFDCVHLRCDRTILQQIHPCLCVRYLQQHGPSLLNFWERQLVCFRLQFCFWFLQELLWNQSTAASLLSDNEPTSRV